MGLYDVHMFMSLFGFGIGMMFASFHVGEVCESKWSYVLEMPLSCPVELLFCFVFLPLGLVLW